MSKLINLRMVRKQALRAAKRRQAQQNAAQHGRTKAERMSDEFVADKARLHLDAHKRET